MESRFDSVYGFIIRKRPNVNRPTRKTENMSVELSVELLVDLSVDFLVVF